jgi:hypothetical protein
MTIAFFLLILALICFSLAAFGVASRVGLVPLGLAFCVLAHLIGAPGMLG